MCDCVRGEFRGEGGFCMFCCCVFEKFCMFCGLEGGGGGRRGFEFELDRTEKCVCVFCSQNIQNCSKTQQQNIQNPPSPRTQSHIRTPTPPRTQYTPQQKLEFFQCPSDVCLGFFRFGRCPRQEKGRSCKYTHTQRGRSRSPNNVSVGGVSRSSAPVVSGGVVWEVWKFTVGVCTYNKRCYTCGGLHAMKVCPVKKEGRRNSVY